MSTDKINAGNHSGLKLYIKYKNQTRCGEKHGNQQEKSFKFDVS